MLSTQLRREYVNVALRKLKLPLRRWASATVTISAVVVASALDRHVLRGRLSFYVALIVQAAISGGCGQLLSEDMQHGASIGGVRIVNPLL